MRRTWKLSPRQEASRLSSSLGVSALVAGLLLNRGYSDLEKAKAFLHPQLSHLHPPELLTGLAEAAQRLVLARERGEQVLVHGDYDADGITATALLIRFFRNWGLKANYFLPHRMEDGYGLSSQGITDAWKQGCKVLVTVDCGITGTVQVDEANSLGYDVLITDHHLPGDTLPRALAVVNPKQPGCSYPDKHLCGAGLAFKLMSMLEPNPANWGEYLQLAALGTVADLVPLTGENRVLVRYGLGAINSNPLPGVLALAKVAGCKDEVDAERIAFSLAPRLNAAGRMDSADRAVELLFCDDPETCQALAEELNLDNSHRQKVEGEIFKLARGQAAQQVAQGRRVLTLYSPNWHQGVVGIVASRIVEAFYRPVFVLCGDGDILTGSARSIASFDIHAALTGVRHLLQNFGGHVYAAGLRVHRDNLEEFAEEVDLKADEQGIEALLEPILELDARLAPSEVTLELAQELNLLRPFGMANPEPKFAIGDLCLSGFELMGKQRNHLRLNLTGPGLSLKGIGFGRTDLTYNIDSGADIDVAAALSINTWQGRTEIQLIVEDVASTQSGHAWQKLRIFDRRSGTLSHQYLAAIRQSRQPVEYIDLSWLPPLPLKPDFFSDKVYNQGVGNYCILEPCWSREQFFSLLNSLPPQSNVWLFSPEFMMPALDIAVLREFYRRWQQRRRDSLTTGELSALFPGGSPGDWFINLVLEVMAEAGLVSSSEKGWQLAADPRRSDLSTTRAWQHHSKVLSAYRAWLDSYSVTSLVELLA